MKTSDKCSERGEEFNGTVIDLSFEGKAVVKSEGGMTFFSEGAWPGEQGRFRIRDIQKNFGYADLIELNEKSDHRRAAPCEVQGLGEGTCGGCPWMEIDYTYQLEQKKKMLVDALARVHAETAEQAIRDVHPSPEEWGYRNRAQFKTNGEKIGFLSNRSHDIVSVKKCEVLNDSLNGKLQLLNLQMPNSDWKPKGRKKWSFVEVDDQSDGYVVNKRLAFRQANAEQNNYMKRWLKEKLSNHPAQGPWVELFAGSGNFTEVLVESGIKAIFPIEVHPSVHTMKRKFPGVNIVSIQSDLFEPQVWARIGRKYPEIKECEAMLLDPPRKGLFYRTSFDETFPNLKRVLYVSCQIGSFVRDLRFFEKMGFRVKEIQPVDQFPQTQHLEILCEMER